MTLVIISTCDSKAAAVRVSVPQSNAAVTDLLVQPSAASVITLPHSLMLRGTELAYKSVRWEDDSLWLYLWQHMTCDALSNWCRVSSDSEIVVVAINDNHLSRDSFVTQPLSRLGQHYVIATYWPSSLGSQLAVVAVEDNCQVNIVFPAKRSVSVYLRGIVYRGSLRLTMRRYETLQIQVSCRWLFFIAMIHASPMMNNIFFHKGYHLFQ